MVVKHMAEQEKTTVVNKTDDFVLKLFWTLSEGQDQARIKASHELVKHLTKKQENSEESKSDDLCPPLVYTVERLVKGLSSGRKWSRLGFSLALTQILRSMEIVSVKCILNLVDANLHFSSHDQKMESGGLMLGQAFVYLSLIQSDRIVQGEGRECIGKVVQSLLKLSREKMYLQSICSQGLTLLIQKCSSKVFKKRVLPNLDELEKGWNNCSIDRLLVVLNCSHYHPDLLKEILEKHWTSPLISSKSFTYITEVFKNCSFESKVYLQVCHRITDQCDNVSAIWTGVGSRLIKSNQQHKLIAGCLFNNLLKVSNSPQQVEELFTRDIIEFLVGYPGSVQVSQCKDEIHKTIIDKVKQNSDPDNQLSIVKSLLREPGGPMFDKLNRHGTLLQTVRALSDDGFDKYYKLIEQFFNGENVDGFTAPECLRCKKKGVFLFRLRTLQGDNQSRLIKLLLVRGYFTVKTPSKDINNCNKQVKYEEDELNMIQNGYLNCLSNFNSGSMVASTHRKQHLNLMVDIFSYAQELLSRPETVTTLKKLSQKEVEAWNKVVVVVKDITSKDDDKKTVEDDAFLFLFLHFGLQIITDKAKLDLSLLEDVHSCYKKVFLKKKAKNTTEEPEWIDVMTEVMLSMMSQSFHLARVMSSTAFKLLVHHITSNSVEQILNVMFSKIGDDGPVNFEDDDDETDENEEDDETDEDDDKEDEDLEDEDESEESEDDNVNTNGKVLKPKKLTKINNKDIESEKESEVVKEKRKLKADDDDDDDGDGDMDEVEDFNEGFRQTVKAALGVAAANSDDEDSDSDLNDSDMERMDEKLVEAFKSMRKPSRKKAGIEAEKQFIAFKLRVVDLIQILVKSDISASVAVSMVYPLLKMMDKAERKDDQKELYSRTKKAFEILYHQKHVKNAKDIDKDYLFKTLQEIIQFATKATNLILVKEISNGCLYILKLLLTDDDSLNPRSSKGQDGALTKKKKTDSEHRVKVLDILRQNLSFFLYNKKDYRFHPGFFNNMFEKFPKLFWRMTVTLLDVLQNDRIKVYNKTLACGFVSTLLVKKHCTEMNPEELKEFENQIVPVLKKFMLAFDDKDNYKPKFLQEILNILFKLMQISPHIKLEITEDVREKISSLKCKFCKNTRQAYNRFKTIIDEGVGKRSRRNNRKNSQEGQNSKPNVGGLENGNSLTEASEGDVIKTPKQKKKSKNKERRNSELENTKSENEETDMEILQNITESSDMVTTDVKTPKSKKQKKRKSDEFHGNGEPLEMSPSSDKKMKLSKSINFGSDVHVKKSGKKDRKRKISL